MPTHTPRSVRRAVSVAALAAVGLGAACVPQPGPDDISHLSRWTNVTFVSDQRSTRVEIAAGQDDPAGAGMQRALEVHVTQAWCDTDVLVARDLAGTSSSFLGSVNTVDGNASVLGTMALAGTETRTPAGPGCATPGELSTSGAVAVSATLGANVQGIGEQVRYTRDDGGEYIYQDADANGVVLLGGDAFHFASAEAAGTWLWEGFWADARGLDPSTLIP